MHPYGQMFLVLRIITAIYGTSLALNFAWDLWCWW
jgi:hypothetical protein